MAVEHDSLGKMVGRVRAPQADIAAQVMKAKLRSALTGQAIAAPKVDRFTVLETLGRGGMGVVHLAYDAKLDRKVALKILGSDIDDPETLVVEARALARLAHPNVVVIYDAELVGDQMYIAMEYVAGQTLERWLDGERAPADIARVFYEAGLGLAAAHEAGLVHGDFKPANVLVGEDGRVRVADFGLARPVEEATSQTDVRIDPEDLDAEHDGSTTRTRIRGTPRYMAPEQWQGQPATPQSDQYSFCVALHEALTGELPGATDSEHQASVTRFDHEAAEQPLWSATRAARLSRPFRAVIEPGLSADPGSRHPTLRACIEPLAPRSTLRRWPYLAAVSVLAAIAGGLALERAAAENDSAQCDLGHQRFAALWSKEQRQAMAIAFAATGRPHAERSAQRVEQLIDAYGERWAAAHREACEATHVRHELSSEAFDLQMRCLDRRFDGLTATLAVLTDNPDSVVVDRSVSVAGALPRIEGCEDLEALRAATPLPEDPKTRERIDTLAREMDRCVASRKAGKLETGLTCAEEVIDDIRDVAYLPQLADAEYQLASLHSLVGDAKLAESGNRAAIRHGIRAGDDATVASAWLTLIDLAGQRGDFERIAELAFSAELAIIPFESLPRAQAGLHESLGRVAVKQGKFDEATEHYEQALEFAKQEGDSHEIASALLNLGHAATMYGKFDEAIEHQSRALEMVEERLGPDHPNTVRAVDYLGATYLSRGDVELGREYSERALTMREAIYGPNADEVAISLMNASQAMIDAGKLDVAIDYNRRAEAIYVNNYGPEHHMAARAAHNVGWLQYVERDYEAASATLQRALEAKVATLGAEHPDVAWTLNALGAVSLDTDALEDAERWFTQALKIRRSHFGDEHPETGECLFNLGTIAERRGNATEALKLYQGSKTAFESAYPAEHPRIAGSDAAIASMLIEAGKADEAKPLLQAAIPRLEGSQYTEELAEAKADLAKLTGTVN